MSKDTFVCFTDTWGDFIWLDAGQVEAVQSVDAEDGSIQREVTVIYFRGGSHYKVRDTVADVVRDVRSVLRLRGGPA